MAAQHTEWVLDKPLEGNPNDLGNIHNPRLDDFMKDEMFGIGRYNYWMHFVGKGSDGKIYSLYGEFKNYQRLAIICNIKSFPGDEKIRGFEFEWDKEKGRRLEKDRIICWAPTNATPESLNSDYTGDYIKYTIMNDRCYLETRCGNYFVDLTFKKFKSFWYNKGKPANVYPGVTIAGIEEMAETHGYILIDGQKIAVKGTGDNESFFSNKMEIVDAIYKYKNEWWLPFGSDDIHGLFVVFKDYRDGVLFIDNEYIIPSHFDYYPNEEDKTVRVKASARKGNLDITYHFLGKAGEIGVEYIATVTGTFEGKELKNGLAWIEHL